MLDQISNAYIGSNISNRLYSINNLVWPNTTGNLWKITDNPFNKTISNFNVTYAGGQVDVNWGKAISGNISSATNINHTFSGITNSGISVLAKPGANITAINCGTSSPRLSGVVSFVAFPNLQDFRCINNGITGSIPPINTNTNLINFWVNDNNFTGPLPILSANTTNLRGFRVGNNRLTGFLPTSLTNMIDFRCESNFLSGSIPNLNTSSSLQFFYCHNNQLTGAIPSLTSNTSLIHFWCHNQTGTNKLSGPIPNLNGLTNLTWFSCSNNQITGFMPNLNTNTALQRFECENNLLSGSITLTNINSGLQYFYTNNNNFTGNIPVLTGFTGLIDFRVNAAATGPRLSGPLPSLSGLSNLQFFYSNGNSHTGLIPNLTTNTSLINFWCANNGTISGNIPNLSANSALTQVLFQGNQLTGFQGGSVSNTLGDFQAQNNQLAPAAVNAILAAFVAANKTAGTRILNLGGAGNFSPTGQGINDVTTLRNRGWTVTTGLL